MNKIPTVFQRDPTDRRFLLPEVTPGCEWVLAGEGRATRKYDGTCVMLDPKGRWWARREVKADKPAPLHFVSIHYDETTGKRVGWEPIEQSGFAKWHAQALAEHPDTDWPAGTYELCGPKVNGNPESFSTHHLVSHAHAEHLYPHGLDFDGLRDTVLTLYEKWGVEGLVWYHPDGRMAKLKARDFMHEAARTRAS